VRSVGASASTATGTWDNRALPHHVKDHPLHARRDLLEVVPAISRRAAKTHSNVVNPVAFQSLIFARHRPPTLGLRHPDRSAPRLGSRFTVGTGHLCQIKFWLMQLILPS
jgi:hypothetical protein